jgi:ADP-heptose:LPS heptosyltransferase
MMDAAPYDLPDFGRLKRIGVLRALQLGDMLCAIPALRALRRAAPRAHITLIGLPWARSFATRYSGYIDDFMVFPGLAGMPEREPDERAMPGFMAAARRCEFELMLQMHGSGTLTNPLCALLGAERLAGFRPVDEDGPADTARRQAPGVDADWLLPWREGEHEVLRFVRLLRFLGVHSADHALAFPVTGDDRYALRLAGPLPAPLSYACVHVGARLASRRWLAVRFAEVADALVRRGLKVILTGTDGERALTSAVACLMRERALDLAGRTSLGALAALVADAAVVVCNDTGMSHLAAAMKTPSVVVCCGSDPRRWAPLDAQRHRVLSVAIDCRPCGYDICPIGHPCAAELTSTEVTQAVWALLA